jgi:hypothetical protein
MRVVFDTGVLGIVTHPSKRTSPCVQWFESLVAADVEIVVPEICDYELRREYILQNNLKAIGFLDGLKQSAVFCKVDSDIWLAAAALWAQCRSAGKAMAGNAELDGDVLLIATVNSMTLDPTTVVATTNVKHIDQHLDARKWEDIQVGPSETPTPS